MESPAASSPAAVPETAAVTPAEPAPVAASAAAAPQISPVPVPKEPAPQPPAVVYIDAGSIDRDLICPVCNSVLQLPQMHLGCGNMFCKTCLSGLAACPSCKAADLQSKLAPVPRAITNKLDALKVACPKCQRPIDRASLDRHAASCNGCAGCGERGHDLASCPSASVSCPAKDVKCAWTGRRDLLAAHVSSCPNQMLRPLISSLLARVAALEQQLQQSSPELRGCTVDAASKLIATLARCPRVDCNRDYYMFHIAGKEPGMGSYWPTACPHCSRNTAPPERLKKAASLVVLAEDAKSSEAFWTNTPVIPDSKLKPESRGCEVNADGRFAVSLCRCPDASCNKNFYMTYSYVAQRYTPEACPHCTKLLRPPPRLQQAATLPL